MSCIVLTSVCLSFVGAVIFDARNYTSKFNFYKEKYHRNYKNPEEEKKGFVNFVNNYNTVTSLNEIPNAKGIVYVLNKFADVNPEEYEEHFGIKLKPYDNMLNVNDKLLETLRERREEKKGNAELYDLYKANELYKDFMKTFNKTESKREYSRIKHFLRFVKTLVEINKTNFEGENIRTLDANADVVKEPNEFAF